MDLPLFILVRRIGASYIPRSFDRYTEGVVLCRGYVKFVEKAL